MTFEFRKTVYDPQTSGGLLAAVSAELVGACFQALQAEYFESRIIGRVVVLESEMLPILINIKSISS